MARKDADVHLTTWNPVQAAVDVLRDDLALTSGRRRVRATTVTASPSAGACSSPCLIEAAGIEDIPIAQVRGWLWQATQTIALLPLDAPPWEEPEAT